MFSEFLTQRLKRGIVRRLNNRKISRVAREVSRCSPAPTGAPVAFFKASTGIDDLSWNSGFHLLASWALRLQGVPVAYFACRAGMSHCVLGTNRDEPHKAPPCKSCVYQSQTLYTGVRTTDQAGAPGTSVRWFAYREEAPLAWALETLQLPRLMEFEWHDLPLGPLCLPGLRWILRRHNLADDHHTRYLLREYILSAWNVAQEFTRFLDETRPRAVVLFNGQFFPEGVARHIAMQRGLPVITHEVGLQPASAFFTRGEATAYPIDIPADFELSAEQDRRLDDYLEQRFQGRFSMAGIQFWPEMKGLDAAFLDKASGFKQIVPIFTNVIFDTSQPHANTVFKDMFAWLDAILPVLRTHRDTLFVIRAHPDELRLRKASRETVQEWLRVSGAEREPNVVFVGPKEALSSYELILRSKFVMVYNSTIGLEASIMGAAVLCAGRARFTQYPTVFFPGSIEEQLGTLEKFLTVQSIEVPPEFKRNARRFLYYQLFRTSLPFGEFLMPSVRTTQTRLKTFSLDQLSPQSSPAMRAILDGLVKGGDFLLQDDS